MSSVPPSSCGCPNVVTDEFQLPSGNSLLGSCAPVSYQSTYGMGLSNLAPVNEVAPGFQEAATPAVPLPANTPLSQLPTAPTGPAAPTPAVAAKGAQAATNIPSIPAPLSDVQGIGLPFDYGQVNYPGATFPYFMTGAQVAKDDTVLKRVSNVLSNMTHDITTAMGMRRAKHGAAVSVDEAVERLRPFWTQRMRAQGGIHDEAAFQKWARTVLGRTGAQVSAPPAPAAPAAPAAPVVVVNQSQKPWYQTFTGVFLMVLLSLGIVGGISYFLVRRYAKNQLGMIKDMLKGRAQIIRDRLESARQ